MPESSAVDVTKLRLNTLKYLLIAGAAIVLPAMADSHTAYINSIPDFTQSHLSGRQFGYGSEMCAPVAVSNSIAWMTGKTDNQYALALQLASPAYMNTNVWKGTGTAGVLNGVDVIANELFGDYRGLEYQGWKKHPRRFASGESIPNINWIKQGVGRMSAVWLNIGWYRYIRRSNTYYRIGGHWVTMVGYDDNLLILHDPAPRAGDAFANEYVDTGRIENGTLVDRSTGLYKPARGYVLLGEGMHIKRGADVAIIDGAVRFLR